MGKQVLFLAYWLFFSRIERTGLHAFLKKKAKVRYCEKIVRRNYKVVGTTKFSKRQRAAPVETTLSAGGPERANQPNSTQRPMVIPANHRGGPENPQNF